MSSREHREHKHHRDYRKEHHRDHHKDDRDDRDRKRNRPGPDRHDRPGPDRRDKHEKYKKPDYEKEGFWSKDQEKKVKKDPDAQKPNFTLTGKLAEDTNTFNGVVIKYNQPAEARIPKKRWRLYPFKGDEALPFIPIHRQSAYLLGRERRVADIPIDHPSCSKQHCVIQFRLVEYKKDDGEIGKRVRPYIIDLESANGTFVNNNKIQPRRFYQLFEKDMIKFGFSTREYVLLHEESKDDDLDDDIIEESKSSSVVTLSHRTSAS